MPPEKRVQAAGGRNREGGPFVTGQSRIPPDKCFQWLMTSSNSGRHHAVALDGTLWGWGEPPVGDGTMIFREEPVRIGADSDWASVSNGVLHTIAMKTDGSVWVIGSNGEGQHGNIEYESDVFTKFRVPLNGSIGYLFTNAAAFVDGRRDGLGGFSARKTIIDPSDGIANAILPDVNGRSSPNKREGDFGVAIDDQQGWKCYRRASWSGNQSPPPPGNWPSLSQGYEIVKESSSDGGSGFSFWASFGMVPDRVVLNSGGDGFREVPTARFRDLPQGAEFRESEFILTVEFRALSFQFESPIDASTCRNAVAIYAANSGSGFNQYQERQPEGVCTYDEDGRVTGVNVTRGGSLWASTDDDIQRLKQVRIVGDKGEFVVPCSISGIVRSISILNYGAYTAFPGNEIAIEGEGGQGASASMSSAIYFLASAGVINGGSGYTSTRQPGTAEVSLGERRFFPYINHWIGRIGMGIAPSPCAGVVSEGNRPSQKAGLPSARFNGKARNIEVPSFSIPHEGRSGEGLVAEGATELYLRCLDDPGLEIRLQPYTSPEPDVETTGVPYCEARIPAKRFHEPLSHGSGFSQYQFPGPSYPVIYLGPGRRFTDEFWSQSYSVVDSLADGDVIAFNGYNPPEPRPRPYSIYVGDILNFSVTNQKARVVRWIPKHEDSPVAPDSSNLGVWFSGGGDTSGSPPTFAIDPDSTVRLTASGSGYQTSPTITVTNRAATPVRAAGGLLFRQVIATDYGCAGISVEGKVRCWGKHGAFRRNYQGIPGLVSGGYDVYDPDGEGAGDDYEDVAHRQETSFPAPDASKFFAGRTNVVGQTDFTEVISFGAPAVYPQVASNGVRSVLLSYFSPISFVFNQQPVALTLPIETSPAIDDIYTRDMVIGARNISVPAYHVCGYSGPNSQPPQLPYGMHAEWRGFSSPVSIRRYGHSEFVVQGDDGKVFLPKRSATRLFPVAFNPKRSLWVSGSVTKTGQLAVEPFPGFPSSCNKGIWGYSSTDTSGSLQWNSEVAYSFMWPSRTRLVIHSVQGLAENVVRVRITGGGASRIVDQATWLASTSVETQELAKGNFDVNCGGWQYIPGGLAETSRTIAATKRVETQNLPPSSPQKSFTLAAYNGAGILSRVGVGLENQELDSLWPSGQYREFTFLPTAVVENATASPFWANVLNGYPGQTEVTYAMRASGRTPASLVGYSPLNGDMSVCPLRDTQNFPWGEGGPAFTGEQLVACGYAGDGALFDSADYPPVPYVLSGGSTVDFHVGREAGSICGFQDLIVNCGDQSTDYGFTEVPEFIHAQPASDIARLSPAIDGKIVSFGVERIGQATFETPPQIAIVRNSQDIRGSGGSGVAKIRGPLSSVTVQSGGSGYIVPPVVSLSGPGFHGKATARIANGAVAEIVIENGGDYVSPPVVTISASPCVTSITVTSGGSGYWSPPAVHVAPLGSGGSGATAVAVVENGAVTRIDVLSPGAGYAESPLVYITGGGGSGATATAVVSAAGAGASATAKIAGRITHVEIGSQGSGYQCSPDVFVVDDHYQKLLSGEVTRKEYEENPSVSVIRSRIVGAIDSPPQAIQTGSRYSNIEILGVKKPSLFARPIDVTSLVDSAADVRARGHSAVEYSESGTNAAADQEYGFFPVSQNAGFVFVQPVDSLPGSGILSVGLTGYQYTRRPTLAVTDSRIIVPETVRNLRTVAAGVREKLFETTTALLVTSGTQSAYPSTMASRVSSLYADDWFFKYKTKPVAVNKNVVLGVGFYWVGIPYRGAILRLGEISFDVPPSARIVDVFESPLPVGVSVDSEGRISGFSVGQVGSNSWYSDECVLEFLSLRPKFSPCQATAILGEGGSIASIRVDERGQGYASPQVVVIGGGGSGCTAVASSPSGTAPFGVEFIRVASGGSGYTSPPTVVVYDGDPSWTELTKAVNSALAARSLRRLHRDGRNSPRYRFDLPARTSNCVLFGGGRPYAPDAIHDPGTIPLAPASFAELAQYIPTNWRFTGSNWDKSLANSSGGTDWFIRFDGIASAVVVSPGVTNRTLRGFRQTPAITVFPQGKYENTQITASRASVSFFGHSWDSENSKLYMAGSPSTPRGN